MDCYYWFMARLLASVDVFERERSFLESTFKPLVLSRPGLRIVLEHCTTAEAAEFIQSGPPNVCASVTPQHLLFNRNHMLAGGIKPHLYCMPILKAEEDRAFLVKAVTAPGQKKFFLGTDSAPHEVGNKHPRAAAPACFPLMHHSNFMPRFLKTRAAWNGSKPSPLKMARTFMGLRGTRRPSF